MGASRPRSGIVPIIGGDGGHSPVMRTKFDFEGAPDSEYFEWIEQTDAVIGMRSIDSLEYAPHALQAVWSEPVNLLRHPNKFDESAWLKQNGLTVKQINESDWVIAVGGGTSDELAQNFSWVLSAPLTYRVEVPKMPAGTTNPWARAYVADNNLLERETIWINCATGEAGERQQFGSGTTPLGRFTSEDAGDSWVFESAVRFDSANPASFIFVVRPADGNGSFTTPPVGTELMVRSAQVTATDADGSARPAFQDNDGVAALDNWPQQGDVAAKLYLVYDRGQVWYAFDNTAGVSAASFLFTASNLLGGIPHSGRMLVYGSGRSRVRRGTGIDAPLYQDLQDDPQIQQVIGQLASIDGDMRYDIEAGTIAYGRFPEAVEGNEFFGLKTKGFARYLIRRKQGVGSQHRPQQENRVHAGTLYPDLSNINDSVNTTTTAVDRADLPAAMLVQVEAEDTKGNIRGFYRTEFSSIGRVYAVGPAANTNTHWLGAWTWLESGSAELAVENVNIQSVQQTQVFEYTGKTGTPLTASDRLAFEGTAGTVLYWAAMDYNPYNARSAHIPVGGSSRIQLEDRPVTTVEACGIDPGRNSIPQSSVQGADAATDQIPDNWLISASGNNGWTWNITEVGADYFDLDVVGTNVSGSFDLFPMQTDDVVATDGQTWTSAWDLELLSGDLSTLGYFRIQTDEREASGTFISGAVSSLNIHNMLSSTRRTFSVARTLTSTTPQVARTATKIQWTAGSGNHAFKFRIWSRDGSAVSLQQADKIMPRKLTTGTLIEFQQWIDGLTMIIEADTDTLPTEFGRWLSLGSGEGSEQNEIRMLNSTGAQIEVGYGSYSGPSGGDNTGAVGPSMLGQHTQQLAWDNVDMTHWADGVEGGTALTSVNPLPTNIVNVHFGHNEQPSRLTQNCAIQSVTFIGERKTTA